MTSQAEKIICCKWKNACQERKNAALANPPKVCYNGSEIPQGKEATMGRKFKDITGQTYGRLTALYNTGKVSPSQGAIWRCRCICGNELDVPISRLTGKTKKSCGCLKIVRKPVAMKSDHRRKDITGQVFGLLTALYDTGRSDVHRNAVWRFRCACGNEADLSVLNVKAGRVISCGHHGSARRERVEDG